MSTWTDLVHHFHHQHAVTFLGEFFRSFESGHARADMATLFMLNLTLPSRISVTVQHGLSDSIDGRRDGTAAGSHNNGIGIKGLIGFQCGLC